jgi:hypothetical protein
MKFEKCLNISKEYFPDLKIKYKNESTFMKLLSYILFFNKKFMSNYVTTIGNTIYYPSKEYIKENETRSVIILCHELMHLHQPSYNLSEPVSKLDLINSSFEYLTPQIFGLFGIFGFLNPYLFLLFLFLLPLPSFYRYSMELEAYSINMYVNNKLNLNTNLDKIAEKLSGPDYYFTMPSKDLVKNHLNMYNKYILSEATNCWGLKPVLDRIIGELNES